MENKTRRVVRNTIIFVLILPAAFFLVLAGAFMAGFGHGGTYFPLMLILGPLSLLFSIPTKTSGFEMFVMVGLICLYELYAALILFLKLPNIFWYIFCLHILLGFIGWFFIINSSPYY